MCEKVFRREESSDLLISFACEARRNRKDHWIPRAKDAPERGEVKSSRKGWSFLFLRAQCSENMFCLSSERRKRHVSPSILMIRLI